MRTILKYTGPLFVLCCWLSFSAAAQDKAAFNKVITRLKALRNYSYQTETNAVFPNGKKEKMKTEVCMDAAHRRLYYKTGSQVLLLTDKWAYKADHSNKKVSVFDVVRYNKKYKKEMPELQEVFKNGLMAVFLDSVLLKSGTLRSAKQEGSRTTYVLSFPEDALLQEMTLVYDDKQDLPERIKVRSFYREGQGKKGTSIETVSSGYSLQVPEDVFHTDRYFRVEGGKVQLQQYKNYTISSIL